MNQPSAVNPLLPELAVWSDPSSAPIVGELLQQLAQVARPIAVGGLRSAAVESLAQSVQCPFDDDLRRMLSNHPARFLLLCTQQTPDAAALQVALTHETTVLLLEPMAGDLAEWSALKGGSSSRNVMAIQPMYLPEFLQCPGWQHAADPLETLGELHTLSFQSLGLSGQGSLFMRLMDAWLTLTQLTDLPESIHAGLSGLGGKLPGSLRQVQGHIQAHARLSQGRNLLVQVSDGAGVDARQLTILAQQAQLTVTDHAYVLHDVAGKLLDAHEPTTPTDSMNQTAKAMPIAAGRTWFELCVWQARQLLMRSTLMPPITQADRTALALACCQACWLSCRTGQPESPREMLRMHLPGAEM